MITSHLPPRADCGRTRKTDLREVVGAIPYIAQTGCRWRLLPKDLPPSTMVQRHFYPWRDSSVRQTMSHVLLMEVREAAGRGTSPAAGRCCMVGPGALMHAARPTWPAVTRGGHTLDGQARASGSVVHGTGYLGYSTTLGVGL